MRIVSKKNIYLLMLLVICLLGLVLTPTYAKFASSFAIEEDIVGLNLIFNVGISNLEEYEEVRIDANSYQIFNIEIANNSGNTAYYGVWYKMVEPLEKTEDIVIARLEENETLTSDSIANDGTTTVSVIIKNNSKENIKVNIGVASSTTNTNDIEYLGGKYLITSSSYEADYNYNEETKKYVSTSDSNVQFTTSSSNYDYTGTTQTFTASHDGYYKLEAWGAQGGSYDSSIVGGKGAYTSGVISLNKDEQLYVYVGSQGGSENTVTNVGGYNGGGYSGNNGAGQSMGGGGATDFRLDNTGVLDTTSLTSRIMVAAGGGGSVYTPEGYTNTAGFGGTLTGGDGDGSWNAVNPTGGTQTVGGTGSTVGSINRNGNFGYATQSNTSGWGGGGGSGYYAGATGYGKGGAGGSSYVTGYKGAVSAGNKQSFKCVYTTSSAEIYDGYGNLLVSDTPSGSIRNIERTLNYVGLSNWGNNGNAIFHGQIFKIKITLANGTVVLYYDFTQNTTNDLSGNGYNGTLKNGASLKYNGNEYFLYLDGVDDYLQVPNLPSSIDFAGGFAIEFEAIWNSLNNYSRILDFGNGPGTSDGYGSDNILITNVSETNQLRFDIYNDKTANVRIDVDDAIAVNGTNYGTDKKICVTGDSDVTCSYHYSGQIFKSPTMIAGDTSMPTYDGTSTMTGNTGNGYAKITAVVPTISNKAITIYSGETLNISDITCIDNGTGCKITRISPADTNSLAVGTYDLQIMVQDDDGVVYRYVKSLVVSANPNSPNLDTGLIPVYYDDITETWKKADSSNTNNSWYDYDKKKWANAILVTDSTRSTYQSATVGKTITESDILGYYVWIPRFKYHVWNITRQAGSEGTYAYPAYSEGIDIVWENSTSSTGNVTCTYDTTTIESDTNLSDTCIYNRTDTITTTSGNSNYTNAWYTHPAFTFGGEEKTGFWIGKFETTGTASTPTVLPDVTSLRTQTVSEQFTTSKVFQNYGLSSNIDAHMLTNLEWGAVSYLAYSKYGLCTGTSCRDIYVNNSSGYYTGRSGGEFSGNENLSLSIAYSGSTTSTDKYNTTGYYTYKGYFIDYNGNITTTKNTSKIASSTGNITGVYDLVGGSFEMTMGNMVNSSGTFNPSSSGTNWNGSSTLNSKYYHAYSYGSSDNLNKQKAFNRSRLGDATAENTGPIGESNYLTWKPGVKILGGDSWFIDSVYPWFMRSVSYNSSIGSLFAFNHYNGQSYVTSAFRSAIS